MVNCVVYSFSRWMKTFNVSCWRVNEHVYRKTNHWNVAQQLCGSGEQVNIASFIHCCWNGWVYHPNGNIKMESSCFNFATPQFLCDAHTRTHKHHNFRWTKQIIWCAVFEFMCRQRVLRFSSVQSTFFYYLLLFDYQKFSKALAIVCHDNVHSICFNTKAEQFLLFDQFFWKNVCIFIYKEKKKTKR